ncbi:hypothetical protein [Sphingobacterium multivorum]|uniref:hypothetical protein n=1 Tax=Sphingobacterium multivorum TaxID=28454 RepID=UPI00268CDF9B|nr:hypothetical protein [Sphingobacterium multivorum]
MKREAVIISFLDVTKVIMSELSTWVTKNQEQYADSFEKNRYSYVAEEEAEQVIECHDANMELLARVKINTTENFDQVRRKYARLRQKYPKCSIGNQSWKPGLTYFES